MSEIQENHKLVENELKLTYQNNVKKKINTERTSNEKYIQQLELKYQSKIIELKVHHILLVLH